MRELGIDIETYSDRDLAKCGVYRYVESEAFAILLFAYSADGGEVECVDLASGESIPWQIREALTDPQVTKTAFNAAFERICLGKYLGVRLDPSEWRCTMCRAAAMGLPLSLGECASVLHLEEGKMEEGRTLIRYFSKPDRKGQRKMPQDAPDKWATFKEYNIRDVEVEQAILARVRRLEHTDTELQLYIEDQRINDRGVLLDRTLAENAAEFDRLYKEGLTQRAKDISGMDNPNSPAQIKEYLHQRTGLKVDTLAKSSLEELEARLSYCEEALEILRIRREMGKTSNAKYTAMLECVCDDGRIHGLLQYYGSRTGRWAGRLVQVQNLPQNHLDDIGYARNIVRRGDYEEFEMTYEKPTHVLSELIRTAFVAPEGKTFHVCDFSAIEARVIAWLAGEKWVLDVFRQGGDIYCATASQMFKVPVEKHGQNAELRQKGKIAVLALGYGGGVSALESMGAKRMGLSEDEEREIVRLWRDTNRRIVRLWENLERAAISAIRSNPDKYFGEEFTVNRGVTFQRKWGMLLVTLPSKRVICYPRVSVGTEYSDGWRGDHDVIEFEGLSQTTKKWERIRTYGGKLAENIVQAIARDILGEVILRARDSHLDIVFHVHDEIVVEADPSQTLEQVEALFSEPIKWCRDLPLKGAGYTTKYYIKD